MVDNMQINVLMLYILCNYAYKNNHKCILSWFKMINMIVSLFIRLFLIFHDLMTFCENFMALIYQENNFLRYKMNYLF